MKKITLKKIKNKLWSKLVKFTFGKKLFAFIYKSYWHYLFTKSKELTSSLSYFTAMPNSGAGIGHQMANWISGYWFAKQFGVAFAHSPFSSSKWDTFLGFGENERTLNNLVKNENFKKVKLPLFEEDDIIQVSLILKIIKSYSNEKVVFVCEQDQSYRDQYGIISEIQEKFYNAPIRKEDKLLYDRNEFNLAIHVRRGDIVVGQNKIENHTMRWLTNDYFVNVLQNTLDFIKTEKKVTIYLFSQGKKDDFVVFKQFSNLKYCLDMNAMDSFLHMVYADVLITSKSSFSYKPALLNKGIKIVPENFWHGYPKSNDWIMVDEQGNLK